MPSSKPKWVPSAKATLRVLAPQALDLARMRSISTPVKQVYTGTMQICVMPRRALALDDGFEARPGHAGEGQVDQLVVAVLEEPARHLGELRRWRRRRRSRGRAGPRRWCAGRHVQAFIRRSSWPRSTAKISRPMPRWRAQAKLDAGWHGAGASIGSRKLHLDVARRR